MKAHGTHPLPRGGTDLISERMNPDPNVLVFDTPEQVAQAAAERFVDYSIASISDHVPFAVALAGGSTPRRAYELLATDEFKGRINWPRVHLFFGDERAVPPDDPQSNYRMVNDALISRIAIPAENVHRIIGEIEPTESAQSYEAELKDFFGKVDWPRFDLVWLGMGADGCRYPAAANQTGSHHVDVAGHQSRSARDIYGDGKRQGCDARAHFVQRICG